jgi:hypothetical protein
MLTIQKRSNLGRLRGLSDSHGLDPGLSSVTCILVIGCPLPQAPNSLTIQIITRVSAEMSEDSNQEGSLLYTLGRELVE